MPSRPEIVEPPEIFNNDDEARKLWERALELLALPQDGVRRLLLDIGCRSGLSGERLTESGHHWVGLDISESMLEVALEREAQGDLMHADMGQGLRLQPGVLDGAISISAVQWLCNADNPRKRLKAFFESLYRSLARGARAVFQAYAETDAQRVLIHSSAIRAGFSGGVVVDYPRSSKSRKEYLVLSCGPPSLSSAIPQGVGDDSDCSDDESNEDEEFQVRVSHRRWLRKAQRLNMNARRRRSRRC
ncbi:hypothetical protein CASFOL_036531 [Castilleja foliolosa]|uniref:Methyltransferase type 11 domain-containing protein n=1 Tax=Castilleja foliolosa TaxID=1961234 RepID=A0ABD3BWN9_9LAMI